MPEVQTSFNGSTPVNRIGQAPAATGSAPHTVGNGTRQRLRLWRITRDGVTASPKRPGWLQGLWSRFSRRGRKTGVDDDSTDGVYRLTRATEEWFAGEATRIEQDAVQLAQSAAAANLPRLEVAYDEVEEEGALAARCRSVLHGWAEQVQTKIEDELQARTRSASSQLREYEHEIGALDGALTELTNASTDLRTAEAAAETGQSYLEVRPFFSRWKYAILITLLVVVDWVANVPVFTELLPKDPGADAAWREIAAQSETMGLWGGLYRMTARALHSIDASLLALGVIVFLVFLAHVFGESLRRLLSHSSAEVPTAKLTIRAHRRQFGATALLSFVGLVGVVGFLWLAREQLARSTAQRVAETEARIAAVEGELAAAQAQQNLVHVGTLQQQGESLRVLREQRMERADYALVINRMNLPILLLNLVLAIAAAVAGYLVTKDALRGALHNPRIAGLRQQLTALHAESRERRAALARLDAAVANELAMTQYLLAARPLRAWEAKADRLRAVIPRFRSENARHRGIDTANIAAFRHPPRLELGPLGPDHAVAPPAELALCQELHDRLRARAAAVLQRMQNDPAHSAAGGAS